MPRIHDARQDSGLVIALRVIGFLVACAFGGLALHLAGNMVGDPGSALNRYPRSVEAPRVYLQGDLHRRDDTDPSLPLMCLVEHQRWMSCGKSHCWSTVDWMTRSDARIQVSSGGPSPSPSLNLGSHFKFEPWLPNRKQVVESGSAEEKRWRLFAKNNDLGFAEDNFKGAGSDRLVTTCAEENEPIAVQGCLSPTKPGLVDRCPGESIYGVVVNGDAQAVLDDEADNLARLLGAVALALLVATLAWMKARRPIMAGLEDRAAPHRKTMGPAWALFGVMPVLGMATVLMHASHPPSTWSTGRGGFAFAIGMLAVWLFFALNRWLHRRRTLFALAPVLDTPRSLLAQASGTVELAVKARGNDLRSFIGDEPIAFTELVIIESYRNGRNVSTQEVYRGRLRDHLAVVDESGEGRLDLSNAVLDVEQRTLTMPALSPRYLERGISLLQHPNHVNYIVKECVIKDDEPLYVFGDVSDISLQASEGGYRTVRGAPTLGGKDAAPVLVHSGDERGLVQLLTREARIANSFAVVAACVCTALGATLLALARI